MRVRLGRWNPGDPPSLQLEAETQDDTEILEAFDKGQHSHRIALGGSWACSPQSGGRLTGRIDLLFNWFKKVPTISIVRPGLYRVTADGDKLVCETLSDGEVVNRPPPPGS